MAEQMVHYLKMKKADGTVVEVPYKATTVKQQADALQAYLTREGEAGRIDKRSPAEMAMEIADMMSKPKKLRKMYQTLVMLGEVKQ